MVFYLSLDSDLTVQCKVNICVFFQCWLIPTCQFSTSYITHVITSMPLTLVSRPSPQGKMWPPLITTKASTWYKINFLWSSSWQFVGMSFTGNCRGGGHWPSLRFFQVNAFTIQSLFEVKLTPVAHLLLLRAQSFSSLICLVQTDMCMEHKKNCTVVCKSVHVTCK